MQWFIARRNCAGSLWPTVLTRVGSSAPDSVKTESSGRKFREDAEFPLLPFGVRPGLIQENCVSVNFPDECSLMSTGLAARCSGTAGPSVLSCGRRIGSLSRSRLRIMRAEHGNTAVLRCFAPTACTGSSVGRRQAVDDRFRTGTPAASVRQGGIVLFQAGA